VLGSGAAGAEPLAGPVVQGEAAPPADAAAPDPQEAESSGRIDARSSANR
jgi:hypothetical protein